MIVGRECIAHAHKLLAGRDGLFVEAIGIFGVQFSMVLAPGCFRQADMRLHGQGKVFGGIGMATHLGSCLHIGYGIVEVSEDGVAHRSTRILCFVEQLIVVGL